MSTARGATLTAVLALAWLHACSAESFDDDDSGDGDADTDADADADADADTDADGDGDGDFECPFIGSDACNVEEVSAGGFFPWRLDPPTAFSAGHTCARLVSGELACWGVNDSGQLGREALRERTHVPGRVREVADATRVTAGGSHTCALRAGGVVSCWGANERGQLGDGTTAERAWPEPVAGLQEGQSVVAGARHTCATGLDGEVACWGDNERGQLGAADSTDGTCGETPCFSTPTVVAGLSGIVEVALGDSHTCARDTVGAVWCWGGNGSGELGVGTLQDRPTPQIVPGLTPVVRVAAGGNQTCVLTQEGHVWCWGALYFDRDEDAAPDVCDDGVDDPLPCAPAPVPVDANDDDGDGGGIDDATAIAVGKEHACALVAEGRVRCWGANRAGQLGDGTLTDHVFSREVSGVTGAAGIAAGRLHTCAWSAAGVSCWGDDERGQVGVAPRSAADECLSRVGTPYPCQSTPVGVEGLPR